jgi:protoporphyrin/coproporphyrin ferrochelatase
VVCLAPQNSRTSVGLYRTSLRVCEDPNLSFDFVESWHDQPRLIQAFAEKLKSGRNTARKEAGRDVPVIFTAHSVPSRTILEGDPYELQARQTAELVAKAAVLEKPDWRFAFQSQGISGGAWLGPTVEATIMDLKRSGHAGVFIQPIGFLCDHVEILYDIDVVFKQFAQEQGMRLWRAESLNDSPLLTAALADVASSRVASKSA